MPDVLIPSLVFPSTSDSQSSQHCAYYQSPCNHTAASESWPIAPSRCRWCPPTSSPPPHRHSPPPPPYADCSTPFFPYSSSSSPGHAKSTRRRTGGRKCRRRWELERCSSRARSTSPTPTSHFLGRRLCGRRRYTLPGSDLGSRFGKWEKSFLSYFINSNSAKFK